MRQSKVVLARHQGESSKQARLSHVQYGSAGCAHDPRGTDMSGGFAYADERDTTTSFAISVWSSDREDSPPVERSGSGSVHAPRRGHIWKRWRARSEQVIPGRRHN